MQLLGYRSTLTCRNDARCARKALGSARPSRAGGDETDSIGAAMKAKIDNGKSTIHTDRKATECRGMGGGGTKAPRSTADTTIAMSRTS